MPSKRTLALLLALISLVPGLALAAGKGRLIGTVVDTVGNPISEATVIVTSKETPSFREEKTTDRKGIFNMKFSGGTAMYQVQLEKEGRRPFRGELELEAGETVRFEFTMQKAGSSTGEGDEDQSDQIIETSCFRAGNVRHYVGLHNSYVYVQCQANEHYLLTMRGRCIGLQGALTISMSDTSERVCSDTRAGILYQDNLGNQGACAIRRVEEVEGQTEAQQLVDLRTYGQAN